MLDQHYQEMGIEPIEYSTQNNLDPYQHTIIKYVTRWRAKGKLRDLKAAALILDKYIRREEVQGYTPKQTTNESTEHYKYDELQGLSCLLGDIPKDKYRRIVTTGRGGMWLAAQLSYGLGITDVLCLDRKACNNIDSPSTLFVDSIVDTGKTIRGLKVDVACLVVKASALRVIDEKITYCASIYDGDDYIDFPIGQGADIE